MNGAFRPNGEKVVHGLFDDAGDVVCADRGVIFSQRSKPNTAKRVCCIMQHTRSFYSR